MTEPTDAEIEQLYLEETGFDLNDSPAALLDFARIVLAKWGQPAHVAKGRKVFICTHCDGVYADQPVTQCDCLPDENTFTEGWICFGAPAQAADPLTYEQILALWSGEDQRGLRPVLGSKKVLAFARAIEATHGIKGGQNVE